MSHPNVINGRALAWACRWVAGHDPRKYLVCVVVFGFNHPLCDAVVDDFGALVEVPR